MNLLLHPPSQNYETEDNTSYGRRVIYPLSKTLPTSQMQSVQGCPNSLCTNNVCTNILIDNGSRFSILHENL